MKNEKYLKENKKKIRKSPEYVARILNFYFGKEYPKMEDVS